MSKQMRKALLGILVVVVIAFVLWQNLPISIRYQAEIKRGEQLASSIGSYRYQHQTVPETDDWDTLKQVGFLASEEARAYPQYVKLDATNFELLFLQGFDEPYLMWNSLEKKWKVGYSTVPGSSSIQNKP